MTHAVHARTVAVGCAGRRRARPVWRVRHLLSPVLGNTGARGARGAGRRAGDSPSRSGGGSHAPGNGCRMAAVSLPHSGRVSQRYGAPIRATRMPRRSCVRRRRWRRSPDCGSPPSSRWRRQFANRSPSGLSRWSSMARTRLSWHFSGASPMIPACLVVSALRVRAHERPEEESTLTGACRLATFVPRNAIAADDPPPGTAPRVRRTATGEHAQGAGLR